MWAPGVTEGGLESGGGSSTSGCHPERSVGFAKAQPRAESKDPLGRYIACGPAGVLLANADGVETPGLVPNSALGHGVPSASSGQALRLRSVFAFAKTLFAQDDMGSREFG